MEPQRIGILGGTFDPIHLGHLIAAQYAYNHLNLGRLILVPSATPVHRPKETGASAEHRFRMCQLAAASLPHFTASDMEIARQEPSFTVITLRELARQLGPAAALFLLVGEDNLPVLHTWRDFREILRLAKIVPMPRPQRHPVDLAPLRDAIGDQAVLEILSMRVPAPLIPLSATDLRRRIRIGKSVAGLVPASVDKHIADNGLYLAENR
jgi:nicotinate-nucleotide adenylyltransferase